VLLDRFFGRFPKEAVVGKGKAEEGGKSGYLGKRTDTPVLTLKNGTKGSKRRGFSRRTARVDVSLSSKKGKRKNQ